MAKKVVKNTFQVVDETSIEKAVITKEISTIREKQDSVHCDNTKFASRVRLKGRKGLLREVYNWGWALMFHNSIPGQVLCSLYRELAKVR